MAAWQASFDVLLPEAGLPEDYAERLRLVLPGGPPSSRSEQVWGNVDGDFISVSLDPPVEMSARFDLRTWRPDVYERFLGFVQAAGATLRVASGDVEGELVPTNTEAFHNSLRQSQAARFVADPKGYLSTLVGISNRK